MAVKFKIEGIFNLNQQSIDKEKRIIKVDDDFKIEVLPSYKYKNKLFEFFNDEVEYKLELEEVEKQYNGEGWDA